MKPHYKKLLAITLVALGTAAAPAQSTTITYQGHVQDNGLNYTGAGAFQFALVTTNAAGTNTLWSNDGTAGMGANPSALVSLGVTNGLFTVVLGSPAVPGMAPLPALVFTQANVQLEVWFSDGVNGLIPFPLQTLTPMPYAVYATLAAGVANGAVSGAGIAPGQVVKGLNGLLDVVTLAAGTNVALTTNGNTLTISSTGAVEGQPVLSAATPPASGTPILNMVWIVPGTFIMGSPTSDPDYDSDETQHVVTLTNGFWMGQHPVTQGEYLAVVGSNPSFFTGDLSRPVETVTWYNATNYCYLLTKNEQSAGRLPAGWVYRLPTESEWEYCYRALTTSRYYFGNDPGDGTSLTNYAWYIVNSPYSTQPVGQLLPNAWGLVDMAGNVFEWCQDWYGTYPTANVSHNPPGPVSGSYRVLRGGSWYDIAYVCRSANRGSSIPTDEYRSIGFRVVLAPGQ